MKLRCKASLREEHAATPQSELRGKASCCYDNADVYELSLQTKQWRKLRSSADRRLSVEVHRDASPRKALSQSHKIKHSPLAFKYIIFLRVFTSPVQSSRTARHQRKGKWHKAFVVLFRRAGRPRPQGTRKDGSRAGSVETKASRAAGSSRAKFVLRERARGWCPFTGGSWASVPAGEHVTSRQASHTLGSRRPSPSGPLLSTPNVQNQWEHCCKEVSQVGYCRNAR